MKKLKKEKISIGWVIALAVLLLDQTTKILAVWKLDTVLCIMPPCGVPPVRVTSFFNLTIAYNRGISFSMMTSDNDLTQMLIVVMVCMIIAGLVYWRRRENNNYIRNALCVIIGGAIGNAIDRIKIGAVIDFLDFHLYDRHWPAFNVADSAIFIGAVIIVYWSVKEHARKK